MISLIMAEDFKFIEIELATGSIIALLVIEKSVGELYVKGVAREGGVDRRTAGANDHHQKKRNGPPGGGPRRRALASAVA